jgi:hypothetical protein
MCQHVVGTAGDGLGEAGGAVGNKHGEPPLYERIASNLCNILQ